MPTCAQLALYQTIFLVAYLANTTLSVAAFFGWRRLRAPWRTAAFVVWVVCALLSIDVFIFIITAPVGAQPSGPACR